MKFPYITCCDNCVYYTIVYPGQEGCKKKKNMNSFICFIGKNK